MIVVYCDVCGAKNATHEFTPAYPWERATANFKSNYNYSWASPDTVVSTAQPAPDTLPVNPTHFDMCKNCVDKFGKLVESFFRK